MTTHSHSLLATVTVTYHPRVELLLSQLTALPASARKIIVDNGTPESEWNRIEGEIAAIEGVEIICLGRNLGLPAALNKGIEAISAAGQPPFVLLLDQDSEPALDATQALLDAFLTLEAQGHAVGAVGPALRDPPTGLHHGFHVQTSLHWKRIFPEGATAPVECASLNGSGTLMRVATWQALGGLDETMFIDHVDTEWSFRLRSAGYELWGVPKATFAHRMGEASVRYWALGWRLWPSRSPQRHYFLFRNAIALMRRNYTPRVWTVWAILKLTLTFAVQAIYDPARGAQCSSMLRGVKHGWHMRDSYVQPRNDQALD